MTATAYKQNEYVAIGSTDSLDEGSSFYKTATDTFVYEPGAETAPESSMYRITPSGITAMPHWQRYVLDRKAALVNVVPKQMPRIEAFLHVLPQIMSYDSIPPEIVVTTDGTIQLEWSEEDDILELVLTPNNTLEAFIETADDSRYGGLAEMWDDVRSHIKVFKL